MNGVSIMAPPTAQSIISIMAKYKLGPGDAAKDAFARHPTNLSKALSSLVKAEILTPWQATRLLAGETQGYRFGTHVMEDRVGSTPIARLYRAREANTGDPVRIIAFRRRHTADIRQVEALRAAVDPLIGWEHPNIVPMLKLGYEPHEGQHYLVTEIPPDISLDQHLKEHGNLEPAEAVRFLEQVAGALVGALGKKAAHRDLGLDTILLHSPDSVKVDCWGWPACFPHTSAADASLRRHLYSALAESSKTPESDSRNDIFFLGCAFHHALVGTDPLGGAGTAPMDKLEAMVPLGVDRFPGVPRLARLIQSMESLAVDNRCPSPVALLDEARQIERTLAASTSGSATGTTVFVVEDQVELQDVIRERFKEYGYRVLIAADPLRALERYSSNPFEAAVFDVGHLGVGVLDQMDELRSLAKRAEQPLRIVLLLDGKQTHLEKEYRADQDVKVLVRPFSVGRIHRTLQSMK